MSPDERGENLRFEGFEFPSFDEVLGTGYQLHPPPYTEDEQFALLENRVHGATLWEAMTLYCGAMRDRVGELFTINQDDYLRWARTNPIESFVSMNSACSDGYSLVKKGKEWELEYHERGTVDICQSFDSLDEAKEYLIRNFSPIIFSHSFQSQEPRLKFSRKKIAPTLKRAGSSRGCSGNNC